MTCLRASPLVRRSLPRSGTRQSLGDDRDEPRDRSALAEGGGGDQRPNGRATVLRRADAPPVAPSRITCGGVLESSHPPGPYPGIFGPSRLRRRRPRPRRGAVDTRLVGRDPRKASDRRSRWGDSRARGRGRCAGHRGEGPRRLALAPAVRARRGRPGVSRDRRGEVDFAGEPWRGKPTESRRGWPTAHRRCTRRRSRFP
jgi:hypothetical protein